MEWLRVHYERVVLLIAALLLLWSAISMARRAVKFPAEFAARNVIVTPKKASPPREAVDLARAQEKLQQPGQWAFRGRAGLFVPEKHFIGPEGLPVTLKTSEVHPPVPNEWLETYGLPIADADVLSQDPDGDGFNNLDEWQGHTNPIEKTSHPDYLTKLKMKSFTMEPFRFIFSSWVGDTYAINSVDMAEPTQFVRVGETISGTRFKVLKFTPKETTNQYGTTVDVSELTLQHLDTKEQLALVKEKVAISPESVVTFEYSWPSTAAARDFIVRRDQEFSLKPNEDIKYKLVDVQPTKAVIVNTRDPDNQIEVGLLGP
ncbi:MAG: Amuc_1099 family pilus-like system protein [Chthoniobacterales bacterium]